MTTRPVTTHIIKQDNQQSVSVTSTSIHSNMVFVKITRNDDNTSGPSNCNAMALDSSQLKELGEFFIRESVRIHP